MISTGIPETGSGNTPGSRDHPRRTTVLNATLHIIRYGTWSRELLKISHPAYRKQLLILKFYLPTRIQLGSWSTYLRLERSTNFRITKQRFDLSIQTQHCSKDGATIGGQVLRATKVTQNQYERIIELTNVLSYLQIFARKRNRSVTYEPIQAYFFTSIRKTIARKGQVQEQGTTIQYCKRFPTSVQLCTSMESKQ